MSFPCVTTFVSTKKEVECALENGATALILEDSKLSVRCFSDDFSVSHFDKILRLEEKALSLNPAVVLSVNCDILVHERHFPLLELLFATLQKSSIRIVRIQDIGLIPWIKENASEFEIHLATETGNNNLESCLFFEKQGVCQQTFTNEMTQSAIGVIIKKIPSYWEILVHGSIVIQYSPRRLISHLKKKESLWKKWSYDERRTQNPFLFYESPHGALMFFWADRSLITFIPQLLTMGLHSWLIDVRGGSEDYLRETVKTYVSLAHSDWNAHESLDLRKTNDFLKTFSEKPFRSVFFQANRTDSIKKKKALKDNGIVGRVVQVVKKHFIVVEIKMMVSKNQDVFYQTPSKKQYHFTIEEMHDTDNQLIQEAYPGDLICLPWRSSIIPQTLLLKHMDL